MSFSHESGPRAIPNSLIKKQLVQHGGKAFLLADSKLKRTDDHEVIFSLEISPYGKDLGNPRVIWTGPLTNLKLTESDLFKDGSEEISFTWRFDPMEVLFNPNQFVSAWGDAIELIKKGYIEMAPQDKVTEFLANPKKSWCYRFVVVAENYDKFEVVLETVPTTMATLKGCPWSESLVTGANEGDKWNADCTQVLPVEYGPGILPYLQDNRLPKFQKESLLPSSDAIRQKMWETLSLMGSSPALDDEELDLYNPAKKRRSPVMPNILLVQDARTANRKRTAEESLADQLPAKSGSLDRVKYLLGGNMTEDEVRALAGNGGDASDLLKDLEDNTRGGASNSAFDTPASIGIDVTPFLTKMPAGVSRDQMRHMTFKNIDMAMKMTESLGVEDRNEAMYRAVTETKMIPAAEHNRKTKLHPVYFFPSSLADPSDIWDQHPVRVEPHVTGIPLTHLGLENSVAPLAIERAGDLSIRLRISYFMQQNVNVQQRAPKLKTHKGEGGAMGLSMDENWKEANKVSQIQDAVFAYMNVMAELFPRYHGPRNLLRVMHKLEWLSFRHDQLFALKTVIDGVLARYQYLAVQKKAPLTFKELQDFVETTLTSMGGRSKKPDSIPDGFSRDAWNKDGGQWNRDGLWSKDSRGWGRGRRTPSAAVGSSRTSPSAAPPICYSYNKATGCLREAKGRMCTLPNGTNVFHLCNQTKTNGDFCLGQHSALNHK